MFVDCWELRIAGVGGKGHTKHFVYIHTDQVVDKGNLGTYGKWAEVLIESVEPQDGFPR